MFSKLNAWLESVFSDSDVNKLVAVAGVSLAFIWLFTDQIVPIFIGLLMAYLLESPVQYMQKRGISRTAAAALVVLAAIAAATALLGLLPLLTLQLRGAIDALPDITEAITQATNTLNAYMPAGAVIHEEALKSGLDDLTGEIGRFLRDNVLGIAVNALSLMLYAVMMPLLVFFLLKDKEALLKTLAQHVPSSSIYAELWTSVDEQFGSYVRGKFIEGGLIGVASWAAFAFLDMNYAFSLAAMIGLSVFVPFVGAILVTIPVVALAYIQFGAEGAFFWTIGAYAVIQIIDAQVLVPILFSEVVKIHPVAIFLAIIFFGSLWGVWGVFFAIPLASLVKSVVAVINARHL